MHTVIIAVVTISETEVGVVEKKLQHQRVFFYGETKEAPVASSPALGSVFYKTYIFLHKREALGSD